jgi:Uma2 family endonuclease
MATVELKKPLVLFRMTSDEFCELPPSETVKLELIDGEVVALCWPTPARQFFIFQLGMEITLWAKRSGIGRVLPDTLMTLDESWTPTPDLAFIARKHLNRVKAPLTSPSKACRRKTPKWIETPNSPPTPDLASPGTGSSISKTASWRNTSA